MDSRSRRVSLRRILLAAAFTAFAFVLASWTPAQADDKGLIGVVADSAPAVGQVLETTTVAVTSTTAALPVDVVDEAVKPPVEIVATVAEKPARTVDSATQVVVAETTKVLSHSTSEVIATVKKVAPASAAVVDPFVAVIAPVTGAPAPAPAPTVPDVVDAVVGAVVESPDAHGAVQPSVPLAEVILPASTPGRALASVGAAVTSAPVDALLGEHVTSGVGSQRLRADGATATFTVTQSAGGSPSVPLTPGPAPGVLGAASGSSSAGSSASGGPDFATAGHGLALPRFTSAAAHVHLAVPILGPDSNPGSRPD